MSANGITVLGLIQSTVNQPNNTIRGYNSDSGLSVGVSGNNVIPISNMMYPMASNIVDTDVETNRKLKSQIYNTIQSNQSYAVPTSLNLKKPDVSSIVFGNNNYSREEVLDYQRRMKSVKSGKGYLYSYDIETIAVHPLLADINTPEINKNNYAITEASLWRTSFKDGKETKEKVFSFIGAPSDINIDEIMKSEKADQTTNVMLQRLAGYSGKDAIVKDKDGNWIANAWKPGVDTTNKSYSRVGVENLQKTGNLRGSNPYIENLKGFVEALSQVGDDDILTTVNGTIFDNPQILAEAQTYGINTDGLFKGHYDIQRLQKQFLSEKIYNKTAKYRGEGLDVDDSVALENLNKMLLDGNKELKEEVAKRFGSGATSHIADYDTFMTMAQSMETYKGMEEVLGDYIDNSLSPLNISDDTVFVSNGKFVSKDSSIHFKVQNGNVNEYNQSIIGRDRAYKMKSSKVVIPQDATEQIREQLKNVDGKYMVELEDLTEDGNKTVMFYDSPEGIQRDLIDSGLLSPTTLDDNKVKILKDSVRSNTIDDIDRDMRGYGAVNSYKKVDKFENFVNQYNSLEKFNINGESLSKEHITSLLNGGDITIGGMTLSPKDVFTDLTNKGGALPIETLNRFKEMYSDLEANNGLYTRVLGAIRGTQSGEYISTSSQYDDYKKVSRVDDMTAAFGSSMREIEEAILEQKSPMEKMEYIINSDNYTKRRYNKEVKKRKLELATEVVSGKHNVGQLKDAVNNIELSNEDKEKLMRKVYGARYKQDLNLESELAKNILRGKNEVNSRHIATSIDILSPNGEYSLLTFGKKENFENSLNRSINRVRHSSKLPNANRKERLGYADDVAKDLFKRGLISDVDLDNITSRNSVRSKVSAISSHVYSNKEKADAVIKRAVETKGYTSVEDALVGGREALENIYDDVDYDIAKPFVDNRIMTDKYIGNRREIMGIPISEHVTNMENAKKVAFNVNEIVVGSTQRVTPNFSIVGNMYSKDGFKYSSQFTGMYEELGWSPQNIASFEDFLSSYNFNKNVQLKNSGGKSVALNKFIINEGGDYKMVMGTNLEYIKEQISRGVPTEEYLDKAVVFKLPKVEEINGSRFVSQSETSKKAISRRAVAIPKGGVMEYKYSDTVDEMIDMLKNDFSYVIDKVEDRNIEGANSRIKRPWRKINETKTLTGNTHVYKKQGNNIVIDSEFIPNRSDISKAGLINHSSLVYEIDSLYKSSDLIKDRLNEMYGTDGAQDIIDQLEYRKTEALKKYGKRIEHMSDLPTELGFKMSAFINNNINDIAGELLKDDNFRTDRGMALVPWLEEMKINGHVAVTGKEMDVVRGYSSTINMSDLVPFSDISGTARNTQIQSLNAHPLSESSMVAASELLPKELKIKDRNSLYKNLGINIGPGITTPLGFERGKETAFGFTAKVKHMTPEQFNDAVKSVYTNESVQEAIYGTILESTGIKADYEEIKRVAKLISEGGGVYEDTGVMDIALAEVLTPRAISHEKVYSPNKELKLGATIGNGTLLGTDVKGRPITYKGESAVIRNIKNNEVLVQLNGGFNSVKLNAFGSEKFVASAPNAYDLDDRMKVIMSKVHNYISGGASVIFNPNVKGHISTNTVLGPSMNAIGMSINNKTEAQAINKRLKEMAPSVDFKFMYDNRRRKYVGIHSPSKTPYANVNPYDELKGFINSFKGEKKGVGERISKALYDIEENGIGVMDLFVAQDNTLERATGTSMSARSANAMGAYMELDKGIVAEYNGTYFKNILKEEANMILEANEIGNRQVSNIYAAYSKSIGQDVDNINIKKINPKNVIAPNGMIEADMLDEVFKFEDGGKKFNLYELDLKDLDIGIELDNPFYIDPREANTIGERTLAGRINSKKTSKVYLPSIMPNYIDGDASLSQTQKKQADFIRELQSVMYKEDNGTSIEKIHERLNRKYAELIKAYEYDLTSKDGLRLRFQKTKENPGTFRAKVQKVIAPTMTNGKLDDLAYGEYITPTVNGKTTYRKTIVVNKASLVNAGLDFDLFGKDIVSMQVAESGEQLEFLKNFLKSSNYSGFDYSSVDNLKSLQSNLVGADINYEDLATKFLTDIGIEGGMSRDPVFRTESFNGTMIKLSEGVQPGGAVIDPVMAQNVKADGDGDELNIMLKAFKKDKNGKLRVMHYGDEVRKELRVSGIHTSDINMKRLKALSEGLKTSKKISKNIFSLEEYAPQLSAIVNDGDANFLTNKTARAISNAANISKNIIGQTSNPGLYIGRAAAEVATEMAKLDVEGAKAYRKSIALGTLIAEQSSIDYKLTTFGEEQANAVIGKMENALNMGKTWDDLYLAVQGGDKTKTVNALVKTMDMLDPYTTDEVTSLSMLWENSSIKNTIEGKNEIAEKIISGKVTRNMEDSRVYLEEFLMDVMTTFRDKHGAKAYISPAIRQSAGALSGVGIKTQADLSLALLEMGNGSNNYISSALEIANSQLDGRFNAGNVMLGGDEVSNGSLVYINKFSDKAEPGVYVVKNNGYKNGSHSLTLMGDEGSYTINGSTVDELGHNLGLTGSSIIDESEILDRKTKAFDMHFNKIEKDILDRDLFNDHRSKVGKATEISEMTVKGLARDTVFSQYNVDNLSDLHETLYSLRDYGIDNKSVLREMNEAIRTKGTKEYQAKKKSVLLNQDSLKAMSLDSARYEKFMQDKVYNATESFDGVKTMLNNNQRVNISSANVSGIVEEAISSLDEVGDVDSVRTVGTQSALGHFNRVDQEAFENIKSVYKNYQHNANFRKEVLGWEFDKIDELIKQENYIGAIESLNNTRLIHSEYAGKRLGELSVDQLELIKNNAKKTGIADDVVRENNTLIDRLINLRRNHSDVMIEDIPSPIIDNLKDNIASDMIKSLNKETLERGKKKGIKSTASKVSDAFDMAKTKLNGLSNKQKIGVGAVALASLGATMVMGSNIKSGVKPVRNEDESNMKNKSLPKAPPSENKVYVSDNNAINVNVKARSPLHSMVNNAEKAIAGLFGQSVNVNTNIQDSRETISDRDVDNMMERAIR